jgi:hypothetical protein
MDAPAQPAPKDRTLARWAAACLGGSALVAPAILFLGLSASSPKFAVASYPGPLLISLVAVVAFFTSGVALTRLGRGVPRDPRRLWRISLFSNLVIVVVLTIGFGLIGFALCLMEMIAIVLHVVALATPTRITHNP